MARSMIRLITVTRARATRHGLRRAVRALGRKDSLTFGGITLLALGGMSGSEWAAMSPTSIIIAVLAALLVLGAAGGVGYLKGVQHESDRHAEFRAEVARLNALGRAAAERRADLALRDSAEVAAHYQGALADLDRGYASRLGRLRRANASCAGAVPADAEPAQGVDGTAPEYGPGAGTPAPGPAEFEAAALAIERNAAADALQLMELQAWVERVCGVDGGGP